MKEFTVEITETLQKQVEVQAETADEARTIVENMYNDEEVVLDADDFIDVEYEVVYE